MSEVTGAPLTEAAVRPLLRGRFGTPWLWHDACPSTQDVLRGTALPEGAVAVAEHQTAGRGRLGRRWEDAPGLDVLVSVLLRPPATSATPQLSLVCGLAVAETVEEVTSLPAGLSWPNDVLLDGRKVAGILVEGDGEAVVCGIGLNVAQSAEQLPAETRRPATSLRVATGLAPDRSAVLALLLATLERDYDTWRRDGLAALLPALERRHALRGARGRIGDVEGVIGPLTADGRLSLVDEAGAEHRVASGELELL